MLQNKIFQNYIKEIIKTFLIILLGLSLIAWTVRAVNFLDLIVENGYPVLTYFQFSILNITGILIKFIPLSFLLSLVIFVIRQIQENEFIILWASGVKKITLVNLFLFTSLVVIIFYYIFSIFLTPYSLNKSRLLLGEENFTSFLPTIRVQQFSDSFKGFTFFVENKSKNEVENIFLHDSSKVLKNVSSDSVNNKETTIIAKNGIISEKKMILFYGQIISIKKDKEKSEIIEFEQLNIDLNNLKSTTIKQPKIQETSTLSLLNCVKNNFQSGLNCKEDSKKDIIPNLNRRIFYPLYIPLIALLCAMMLIKTKKNFLVGKASVFIFSFTVLIFAEMIIRYTGMNKVIFILFVLSPIVLSLGSYSYLLLKFKNESKF